jgi:Cu/Ag efflux pump CusA
VKEKNIVIELHAKAGVSLKNMNRTIGRMEIELQKSGNIKNIFVNIGHSVTGDQIFEINSAKIWIELKGGNYEERLEKINSIVENYPGFESKIKTYTSDIWESRKDFLENNQRSIRVYGPRFDILEKQAKEIILQISKIEGIENIKLNEEEFQPQIEVKVDLEKARKYGIKPGDVRRAVSTLVNGIVVGNIFKEQKVYSVVV